MQLDIQTLKQSLQNLREGFNDIYLDSIAMKDTGIKPGELDSACDIFELMLQNLRTVEDNPILRITNKLRFWQYVQALVWPIEQIIYPSELNGYQNVYPNTIDEQLKDGYLLMISEGIIRLPAAQIGPVNQGRKLIVVNPIVFLTDYINGKHNDLVNYSWVVPSSFRLVRILASMGMITPQTQATLPYAQHRNFQNSDGTKSEFVLKACMQETQVPLLTKNKEAPDFYVQLALNTDGQKIDEFHIWHTLAATGVKLEFDGLFTESMIPYWTVTDRSAAGMGLIKLEHRITKLKGFITTQPSNAREALENSPKIFAPASIDIFNKLREARRDEPIYDGDAGKKARLGIVTTSSEFGDRGKLFIKIFDLAHDYQASDVRVAVGRNGNYEVVLDVGGGTIDITEELGKEGLSLLNEDGSEGLGTALVRFIFGRIEGTYDTRVDQQGAIDVETSYGWIRLRVQCNPQNSEVGWNISMRRVSKTDQSRFADLNNFGYPKAFLKILIGPLEDGSAILELEQGAVLITGPTNSGKSTLLYALYRKLCEQGAAVHTAECPIEHEIPGLYQHEVDYKTWTFAQAIAAFLRSNPGVVGIGEIKDFKTAIAFAGIADQGTLAFTTLHQSRSLKSYFRLRSLMSQGDGGNVDFGALLGLLDQLKWVVAQVFVRRICQNCSFEEPVPEKVRTKYGFDLTKWRRRGNGCIKCFPVGSVQAGFRRGRGIPLVEAIRFTPVLVQKMISGATFTELLVQAMEEKQFTMLRCAETLLEREEVDWDNLRGFLDDDAIALSIIAERKIGEKRAQNTLNARSNGSQFPESSLAKQQAERVVLGP